MESYIKNFKENGYVIFDFLEEKYFKIVQDFSKEWIINTLQNYSKRNIKNINILKYHKYFKEFNINHNKTFQNANRVIEPPNFIAEILLNKKLKLFLKNLLVNYEFWRDPGLGWLCYRFIRPNFNDGYHLCKKAWGPANKVLSAWLPVIGFDNHQMLQILPESHKMNIKYQKKVNQKFVEPTIIEREIDYKNLIRPSIKEGQILLYDANLLHSENIVDGDNCRMNLEFRFNPL
jgi:hypothetical protein